MAIVKRTKGMTLVELMVSLVILMIVFGAIYSILNIQQTRTTQVSKTTILQTDAQVAFTLIKWDLLLAGLGYPYESQDAIQLIPVSGVQGAGVRLKAVGLGFEMNRSQWSYLLDEVKGPIVVVRRWSDTLANFLQNDRIMILNEMRKPIYQNLVITNDPRTDTFTFIDPLWGNSIPATKLVFSSVISAREGAIIFKRTDETYLTGITYQIVGDTLKRGNEALLNNVEAIAFRYGLDTDGDRIIDTWGDRNNPPFNPSYTRKWAIRFTVVIASEAMAGYRYGENTVTIEQNPPYTYPLTPAQQKRKRVFMSSIVYPQNLQPGEGL